MQDPAYGLPRILLPKLSEKVYERRSERGFGRYTKHKTGQRGAFVVPLGYAAGASDPFRTVSPGNKVNRPLAMR